MSHTLRKYAWAIPALFLLYFFGLNHVGLLGPDESLYDASRIVLVHHLNALLRGLSQPPDPRAEARRFYVMGVG